MCLLLFIGTSPYAIIKDCDADDITYLLDNYGFNIAKVSCFSDVRSFEEWNDFQFNGDSNSSWNGIKSDSYSNDLY